VWSPDLTNKQTISSWYDSFIPILALLALFWLFYLKTNDEKDAIGIECSTKKKFCVLQKKVLSFGPNRTLEVRPNSSAEPNVRSVTTTGVAESNL
jgi:hypothetical protein